MSSFQRDMSTANRPRSRRSLAQIPQAGGTTESDKENRTVEGGDGHVHRHGAEKQTAKDKKLRSKSLGPGGLDALGGGNANRRKSTAAPLKSILKPTVPLSPPRHIPSFEESRKKTPVRRSPRKSAAAQLGNRSGENGLLIDFSTPGSATIAGSNNLANPFDTFDPLPGNRDGETGGQGEAEQQESERLERERREREKQAILQQREARRKSMANRRVSFAPEATLHTWNVVELGDDYTSSSGSANSTRRASSLATPSHDGDRSEARDTQVHHGPQIGMANHDEALSSSPFSGSSAAGSDDMAGSGLEAPHDDASFSDSDDADSTAMSVENVTQRSISSHSEGSSSDSSGRLDQSLRQAAVAAGTRGIDYDENGDEAFNHEIVGAFKPWVKKGADRLSLDADDLSSRLDQENVNPFTAGRSHQPASHVANHEDGHLSSSKPQDELSGMTQRRNSTGNTSNFGGQTMDLTNVVGGIERQASPPKEFSSESEVAGDEENEEMTMEFTSVFGGVIPRDRSPPKEDSPGKMQTHQMPAYGAANYLSDFSEGVGDGDSDAEMEMTGPVGTILPPIEEDTEPLEDETMGMEMTHPVGKILTPTRGQPGGNALDDQGQPESSPFQEQVVPSPVKPEATNRLTPMAAENGSPGLASVKRKSRGSGGSRKSTSPGKASPRRSSPSKTPTTPTRQSPRKVAPRTPPSRLTTSRNASPARQPASAHSAAKAKQSPAPLFRHDAETGQSTPSFVLRPPTRSPSGLGIDKEGLGSPRVAEMLDRRRSIGDEAQHFVPQNQPPIRGVRFEGPEHFESELDGLQRSRHETLADGINLPAPDKDSSLNLRDMISSMSPQKNKSKARKSLHVGSAKGLLGKRPAELDDDEKDDDTPKRLKGREASPVKSVRLPAPPSKAETVGKAPRLSIRSASEMSNSNHPNISPKRPSPEKRAAVFNSADGARREDEEELAAQNVPDYDNHDVAEGTNLKPIQLSQFLEMTNIHFMELTTTKRRHTMAPDVKKHRTTDIVPADGPSKAVGLEDCVAAGFCTVPMLELYQHSCRELKSYISEGRSIIRSIEDETFADNPPLFQEYVNAPPDIRLLMDNQFRNVKTHARLQSKSMWYEWRMKLLEGLKQGLDNHVEEMKADDTVLSKKEKHLDSVVPQLAEKHSKLEGDADDLERVVQDMENCDLDELRNARGKLSDINTEIEQKKRQLEEMQAALQEKSDLVEDSAQAKTRLTQEIDEAEGILEQCRGWSVDEVQSLKASVSSIEQRTGWAVTSVIPDADSKYGPTIVMRYRDELRVGFKPKAFSARNAKAKRASKLDGDTAPTITYSPGVSRNSKPDNNKTQPTSAKALMLHAMRRRLSQLSLESTTPKAFLADISKSWDTICGLENDIRKLEFCGVTRCKVVDSKGPEPNLLRVRCILLGASTSFIKKEVKDVEAGVESKTNSQSRIDIDFTVQPNIVTDSVSNPTMDIDLDVVVSVTRVYGLTEMTNKSAVSENRMRDFLNKTLHTKADSGRIQPSFGNGLWREAVKDLQNKVLVH